MLRGHVFKFQTFSNEAFSHFINTFLQGNMGITKGCEISSTTNSVTIGAGFFCVMGRFLEIVGNETIEDITDIGYYRLVCEIDLSKTNTSTELNQAKIKVIYNASNFETLTQENLIEDGNIYQFEFAKFRVTDVGITDIEDKRTFLDLNSLYNTISDNFTKMYEQKGLEADNLLDEIRQELESIVDGSAFFLKSSIQIVRELPASPVEGTIYIQIFD